MQAFFKTYKYLLDHFHAPFRRELYNEIDWKHRLIGIKGARGIGKTTFLLDFAKEKYGADRSCLYVNMNNLCFADRSIVSFADEFRKTGGKTLILDQVYKYPLWSDELKYCYDHFKDLQIIFSGSPVMRIKDENPQLKDCVSAYTLNGFSFREYLNLKSGNNFKACSLDDLLENHEDMSREIIKKVKPLAFFNDYLHHGYYPFFLEKQNHFENLIKNINFVLEIDISYLQQVELKYLSKLRKLLYLVAQSAPFQPNVSKLSAAVETSRATIMNYLQYLKQAQLINLLYEPNGASVKKPARIYMQNPNLVYSVFKGEVEPASLHRTFFYNQVGYKNEVGSHDKGDFFVNEKHIFHILDSRQITKKSGNQHYLATDMIEVGKGQQIPLWLFGFLY